MLTSIRHALRTTPAHWNYVTVQEYHDEWIRIDHVLIDLRKPKDFSRGHIQGARNVFWKDLFTDAQLASLPTDKPLVLACYVGHTASQAVAYLRLLGYDAKALKYGYGVSPVAGVPVCGWIPHGFPVVTSKIN